MDIFSQYATDPNLELHGVWHTIGPAEKNLEDGSPDPASAPAILVARAGNKRHARLVSQQYEANRQLLDSKTEAADDKGTEITIDTMAKGILLGWRNLTFQGVALPEAWDYETAKKLLAIKDFRDDVNKRANDVSKYKAEQEAEDAKN